MAEETISKKIPKNALLKLIDMFFNEIRNPAEKGNLEFLSTVIEGLHTRGFSTDELYWMSPELRPTEKDLAPILEDLGIPKNQIESYLKMYKDSNYTTS